MRLFVAVWPPPDVIAALAALDRPAMPGLRWTTPEQWHVTLRFLGSVDPEGVADVVAAVDVIEAAPVTVTFGPTTEVLSRQVLHVPVRGVEAMAAATVAATTEVGEPPDPRPFRGHLTLARVRGRARVDLRRIAGEPCEGSFPVSEVTLVRSHTRPQGARYEVIHRRRLARA